ncbi:MAG: leucine-rich repeat domain-containing protein [Candidatus Nanoarchaeia archaeon]|nr:leucine-rich repeat domain-containing protein [Candidatus Nanoarchaeia archaeon]
MNIDEIFPEMSAEILKYELKENYEVDFDKKNSIKKIKVDKSVCKLFFNQYETLKKILKQTSTGFDEIRNYHDGYAFEKYFGIKIENYSVIKMQINGYVLEKMPLEIADLSELTHLNFFSNNASEIPKQIRQLTLLQNLGLGWNKITSLPKEMGELTRLIELNLFDNKIKKIPKGMENLTQLQYLNLRGNSIKKLPKSLELVMRGGAKVLL